MVGIPTSTNRIKLSRGVLQLTLSSRSSPDQDLILVRTLYFSRK